MCARPNVQSHGADSNCACSSKKRGNSFLLGIIDLDKAVEAGGLENALDPAFGVANLELTETVLQQLGAAQDHAQAGTADIVELFEVEQNAFVSALRDFHHAIARVA